MSNDAATTWYDRLVTPPPGTTEADIQSWIAAFLVQAPLDLSPADVSSVGLERYVGRGNRIDIEVGQCVIEVKRSLRSKADLNDAEAQLARYLASKAEEGSRYSGLLTDGQNWRLYTYSRRQATCVAQIQVKASQQKRLESWLAAVLATRGHVAPTPGNVEEYLGADSPAHRLDFAALKALWEENADNSELGVKKELWGKLLETGLGEHADRSVDMFIEHTYLVVIAELIAHHVLGLPTTTSNARTLLTGQQFADAGIRGVVEADFFDWPIEVDGGSEIVMSIARRVAAFDWTHVSGDILKILYESVVDADQRKRLGEYYTPDWLAEGITEAVITDPAKQVVLDPSCGSGTFLLHAVRRVLSALDDAGTPNAEALEQVTRQVYGIDVHPVAVSLARTTYLLAIGAKRLQDRDRLTIPVYLGDSIQWQRAGSFLESDFRIETAPATTLYSAEGQATLDGLGGELLFPDHLLDDPNRFSTLVNSLVKSATARERGAPYGSISGILAPYALSDRDRRTIENTYAELCRLHDARRNHIWAYYVTNLARPVWLSKDGSQIDVLIGNPPWLAYRYMPKAMQQSFKTAATDRQLWVGGNVATQQELAAYFIARAAELYLKDGGSFGFVVPFAALSRQAWAPFRTGTWGFQAARFSEAWDLQAIRPQFFPVPSAAVFGTYRRAHTASPRPLPSTARSYSGTLRPGSSWTEAEVFLNTGTTTILDAAVTADPSPYGQRFTNGATVVPRMLFFVEDAPPSALGLPRNETLVVSRRTTQEKAPWKTLPDIGPLPVETRFVRHVHLGETILPHRPVEPLRAILPVTKDGVLSEEEIRQHRGLNRWWKQTSNTWMSNRSASSNLSLMDQVDYMRKLDRQFPIAPLRVVYTKAGNTLAAAVVDDPEIIIDHKLYWAPVRNQAEGDYIAAILNAPHLTTMVQPLMSTGAFGPRDFDKYVWRLAIPEYDASDPLHVEISQLGSRTRAKAAEVDVTGLKFQRARRVIRDNLASELSEADNLVRQLLGQTDNTTE